MGTVPKRVDGTRTARRAHRRYLAAADTRDRRCLAEWRAHLATYPEPLRQAVLQHFGGQLRYWRDDYHNASKAERADLVFLAGLTSNLIHAALQVLFALNRRCFVDDGWNLRAAADFALRPADLDAWIAAILDPGAGPDRLTRQYRELRALIDDVLALTDRQN